MGCKMVQWLLSSHSQKVSGLNAGQALCVEFACAGSLQVLWLPNTVQKNMHVRLTGQI